MNEVVVSERNERLKRLDNLERVYAEAETKVRNKRAELKTLAAALGTGDSESLTVAQQSTLQQFGLMQEKLSDVQYQLMQAQGEIKILQDLQTRLASADESKAEVVPADAAPEEEVVPEILESDLRTPDIVRIEGQLASLQAKLSSSQSVYGAKHPSIRRIMEEIKVTEELLVRYKEAAETRARELAQERQVQKLSEDARSGIITKNGSTMVDPDRIVALAAKIEMLQSQEKTMQEKVDALSAEAKQLGRSSVDVELMRSEITGLEEVLSRVGAEVEKTNVELKTGSRVTLVNSAEKPTPPDVKKRIAATIGLSLLGLVLPIIGLVAIDLKARKVSDALSTGKSLAMPVFGILPFVKEPLLRLEKKAKFSSNRGGDDVALNEAIDSISILITQRAAKEHKKVILVTSAIPKEGKSTVSCQLAQSLAMCAETRWRLWIAT